MSESALPPTSADWLPAAELVTLHATLAALEDDKIPRLLAIVDRLEHRGAADNMIAPFRVRMSQLGIARPLRFTRLLFMPLDPVIVAAADWQAKSPLVPRSALLPLAGVVRNALGAEACRLDQAIGGYTTRDCQVIGQEGPAFWDAAARILLQASPPEDWTAQTGFPAGLFPSIACGVGAVLGQVCTLETWRAELSVGIGVRTGAARNLLQRVHATQPGAIGLLFALTLVRLPQAIGALRQAIAEIGGRTAEAMLEALEAATESLVGRLEAANGIETAVLRATLRNAGTEVDRMLRLIGCVNLEQAKPAWRSRLAALRRRLSESAQLRFVLGLQKDFLRILEDPALGADTDSLLSLEEAARGLWSLATEASRIGHAAMFETLIRQTTAAVKAIHPVPTFTLADKVRLVEILAGSDAAWAMLTEQSGEAAMQD